jgi:hypothetical protein
MRSLFASSLVALLALVPCMAQSASAMSVGNVGMGPHGYDFLIGSWSCKNKMPSTMGGPATTTAVIAHSANGTLSFHATAAGFDAMGYIVYAPKTKTWWNPSAASNGSYGAESTHQTGKKTVWSGPFVDPSSRKTVQVRDTYTFESGTTYTDLYQVERGGTWKTEGDSTCSKT